MTTEPLVICTAWNAKYSKLGELCSESILQHIRRIESRGGSGVTFVSQLIPDDYPRPPSWYKLLFIADLIQSNPHVMWIDCDALLVDQGDIREGLKPNAPLMICEDCNGLNGGVMFWNQGLEASALLDRIEALSDEFMNHRWWETAAMQKDLPSHPQDYQILDKSTYNAYSNELCPTTKILHFAGFHENDDRSRLMEAFGIMVRRNGHGPKKS